MEIGWKWIWQLFNRLRKKGKETPEQKIPENGVQDEKSKLPPKPEEGKKEGSKEELKEELKKEEPQPETGGPRVIIPQHVIKRLIEETLCWPNTETGEALVGIIVPPDVPDNEPTFVVLGTIPPGRAVREGAYFRQGGQDAFYDWLSKNWDKMRELSRGKIPASKEPRFIPVGMVPPELDGRLRYVGDYHKHPGLLKIPSSGDLQTAMEIILEDNNIDYLLVPITTSQTLQGEICWWNGNKHLVCDEPLQRISISFSYLSQKMLKRGQRAFLGIQPTIVPDYYLPRLPILAWHLEHKQRFKQELWLLKDYGCDVVVFDREMTGAPPLEVCFAIKKSGWQNLLLLVTSVDYPKTPPEIKIYSLSGTQPPPKMPAKPTEKKKKALLAWFESAWEKAKRILIRREGEQEEEKTKEDLEGKFLVQYVWDLEKEGKL